MLTGCKEEDGPLTEKKTAEIKAEIEAKFEDFPVEMIYGKYKGYVVFTFVSQLPAEYTFELGGEIFYFSSMNQLWTLKNDKIVLLEKVYDRGDLMDSDISKIHSVYLGKIIEDGWYERYQKKVEEYKNSEKNEDNSLKSSWNPQDTKDIIEIWEKEKGVECTIDCELGKYNYSHVFLQVGTKYEKTTRKVAGVEFRYTHSFTIKIEKSF